MQLSSFAAGLHPFHGSVDMLCRVKAGVKVASQQVNATSDILLFWPCISGRKHESKKAVHVKNMRPCKCCCHKQDTVLLVFALRIVRGLQHVAMQIMEKQEVLEDRVRLTGSLMSRPKKLCPGSLSASSSRNLPAAQPTSTTSGSELSL